MTLVVDTPSPEYFKPLGQKDYQLLQQGASLKAFLMPFKGKGAVVALASHCDVLRDQLITLGKEHVLQQVKTYPFSLLPVQLGLQTTGAGTAFLRWRKTDRSVMGVHLWDDLMANPSIPDYLIADLYAMELQRISLNMQISLLHTIARQASACAVKAAHAQAVFEKRINIGEKS